MKGNILIREFLTISRKLWLLLPLYRSKSHKANRDHDQKFIFAAAQDLLHNTA